MNFDEVNKEKKKYETGMIIGGAMTGIGFISFIPMGVATGLPFFSMLLFMGGAIVMMVFSGKIKQLSVKFKDEYVPQQLSKVFPGSKYYSDYGFSEEEVIYSKLLKNEDRFFSEDMIEGSFDGVKFRSSDVHQQDVRGSGKNRKVVTVFRGRLYEFDLNKNFKYNLLLLQNHQYRPFSGYNKIKTESINFNSELKVYAKDDHEAFYILTPHFMEELLVLDRKYNDRISFSFFNSKLYIAVDNRVDNFDLKAFKPVNEATLNEYLSEFSDMKDFMLQLKLNSRIFKDF